MSSIGYSVSQTSVGPVVVNEQVSVLISPLRGHRDKRIGALFSIFPFALWYVSMLLLGLRNGERIPEPIPWSKLAGKLEHLVPFLTD
jgi:hypothetical protein